MCVLRGCARPTTELGLCHADYLRQLRRRHRDDDCWLLGSDGIHDPIAIEVAASGERLVRLCPTERLLAACKILARGGSVDDVRTRLGVDRLSALSLVRTVLANHRQGQFPENRVAVDPI
jgi:hypothetical protein